MGVTLGATVLIPKVVTPKHLPPQATVPPGATAMPLTDTAKSAKKPCKLASQEGEGAVTSSSKSKVTLSCLSRIVGIARVDATAGRCAAMLPNCAIRFRGDTVFLKWRQWGVTWTGVTPHENPSLRLQVPVSAQRNASPVAACMSSRPRLRHCIRGDFY